MSGDTVFITGANGFIGSHLARHLAGRGFKVRGLVREESSRDLLRDVPVDIVTGDLFDTEALESGIRGCSTMYHVAGVVQTGDPETYFKVNLDGTKSVLAAAARAGGGLRRFLHVSSISVMGPSPDKTPLNENSPLRPVSLYGKSKLRGEQAVRASGLPWTIIRPTNILGPGQRELFTILQALRKGFKPRIGTGEKQTTICFVWDLVRAMADAAESEKTLGKTYIVSSREPYSFDSLMDIALKELGRDKVLSIPFPVLAVFARLIQVSAFMRGLPAPFDPEKLLQTRKNVWFHDPGAIERDIGFTTGISAEEGIRRTIEYYRSNNWQL